MRAVTRSAHRPLLLLALPLAGSAAVLALLAYLFWDDLSPWWLLCTDLNGCKVLLRDWVAAAGSLGPVVFVLLQALQVVAAPIPGEVTGFLGGFLFGPLLGFWYSTLGITLGSTLAFLIGRALERTLIERLVSPQTLQKLDFVVERQGAFLAFVLFMIPGAPKDYLCFILGLTPMPLPLFLAVVGFGRMPATLVLTLQGAQVYQENYPVFFLLLGVCLAAALLAYLFRDRLYAWLRRQGRPPAD
jgi:uncharacterized membrane protein YdjX (TVP38/TMEM64 family)